MWHVVLATFVSLSATRCEAALTVTYEATPGDCKFKATVAWADVAFGDFSYATMKYIQGAASAADCTNATTVGGTISQASGSEVYQKTSGIPAKCYFEGNTEYTFFVCDGNSKSMMPMAKTTPEFIEGSTTLTSCTLDFEKGFDDVGSRDYYMANLSLAAQHVAGSAGAPGLGSAGTITLTSSAVSGSNCDSLKLTSSSPTWIPSGKATAASVSTSVSTKDGGNLEFNSSPSPGDCVTAWSAANGKNAAVTFHAGSTDAAYASTDGSAGVNFGLASGCAITWVDGTKTTTIMKQATTATGSVNSANSARRLLLVWFSFFCLGLRVAFF
jgi:putative salt-induced outer membrane protein YdiY